MARRTTSTPEFTEPVGPGSLKGTPKRSFGVYYRDAFLQFVAGRAFAPDAALQEFLVNNELPVDWEPV